MIDLADFHTQLETALAAEIPGLSVVFGAEYLYRRDGQSSTLTANRVVVAEYDESGETGEFMPPQHNHRAPPDVGIDRQTCIIELWAYDGTAPRDAKVQYKALACLRHAVWRHVQTIIRAEYHVTPNGEPPGFYQIARKALQLPSERVHGKRERWSFWIDFSIRDIAPTTLDEPDLDVTAEMETP